MRIYMDLTHFLRSKTITGIQRVTWEYVQRLMQMSEFQMVFLNWDFRINKYAVIDSDEILWKLEHFDQEAAREKEGERIYWSFQEEQREEPSVFFEVDAAWNGGCLKRGFLYSELRKRGIKIVVFLQDVIPVMCSQYVHSSTVYRFYDFLAAAMKYAEVILTSTKSTCEDIKAIAKRCSLEKRIEIVGLGTDFAKNRSIEEKALREDVRTAVSAGRYLLIVATIEPRKNHKFLLDCFEKCLVEKEVNLVIAGREGWKCEELLKRIRNHTLLGTHIFFIEAADDLNISYLYEHAFLFVFPSFYEGYGLPIVEAMQNRVPVLASDIPVFREIGQDFCEYFQLDDITVLGNLIGRHLEDREWHDRRRELTQNYVPPRWEDSVSRAVGILDSLVFHDIDMPNGISQIYMISAREDDVVHAISYIEKYIPFIKKILVGTPKRMVERIRKSYHGKLMIDFLYDEEAWGEGLLPTDHTPRNFLLRCAAMRSSKLDDVFLMYDDDYRPLVEIKESDYLENGKYISYYFYDLRHWCGKMMDPTSFDRGMYRTLKFLQRNSYPVLQYAAHMPQVIDKRIFLEILQKYPGIELEGYDEWSLYFNYANAKYPHRFLNRKFKTLCWPALATDWYSMHIPEEYLFENYYPILYEKYNLKGMPENVEEQDERSTMRKILCKFKEQFSAMHYRKTNAILESYDRWLRKDPNRPSSYMLVYDSVNKSMELYAPDRFFSRVSFCNRPTIRLVGFEDLPEEAWDLEMTYRFDPISLNGTVRMQVYPLAFGVASASLPVIAPGRPGAYELYLWCESRNMKCKAVVGMMAWIYRD